MASAGGVFDSCTESGGGLYARANDNLGTGPIGFRDAGAT